MKFLFIFLIIAISLLSEPSRDSIYLFGEITEENSKDIVSQILNSKKEKIILFINSSGGDVDSGLAIINALKLSHKKISTIGIGGVYSMAFYIFLCGDQRHIFNNTTLMLHNIKYTVPDGISSNEIKNTLNASLRQERFLYHLILSRTSIPHKKVKFYFENHKDFYISQRDALKYKVAHSTIGE